jgi:hypothetical protein
MLRVPVRPEFRCFECAECHFVVIEIVAKSERTVRVGEFASA